LPEKRIKTNRERVAKLATIGFATCLIFLWAVTINSSLYADEESNIEKNTKVCAPCHEEIVGAFMKKPHAVIDEKGWMVKDQPSSCTSCHGDAQKHLENEGGKDNIFTFSASDTPVEKAKKCLQCHNSDTARFFASPHGKASLDCTECHTIHGAMVHRPLLKTAPSKSCGKCHEDIFVKFRLNEGHRLIEGILDCTNCHDPHEPSLGERLPGFKHQACLRCHVDKGGPYLYEHAAGMIEGCTSCHDVHGSPNRHMLLHQSTGDLCFSCHVGAPSWHERFKASDTNCTICHSAIHGSNLDKLYLK